jgi:hypothetical protein
MRQVLVFRTVAATLGYRAGGADSSWLAEFSIWGEKIRASVWERLDLGPLTIIQIPSWFNSAVVVVANLVCF